MRVTSSIHDGDPCAEEQYVYSLLLCVDHVAYLVYNTYQTRIRFYEYKLALWIKCFALSGNTISRILRTPYEVRAWLDGMLRELLQSCFADPARGSDKDRNKFRRESGRDERV